MGWSQDYLEMLFRVRSTEHDFTTAEKDLWNRKQNPSPWTALQLWQKAPGNTKMHWPVLWVQLEGTVLALVFVRSPNATVKKGFPQAKLKRSCVWQLAKLFIWDQTEISEVWSAAFVTSAYRSRSMEGTWGWVKFEHKVIQYLLWGRGEITQEQEFNIWLIV